LDGDEFGLLDGWEVGTYEGSLDGDALGIPDGTVEGSLDGDTLGALDGVCGGSCQGSFDGVDLSDINWITEDLDLEIDQHKPVLDGDGGNGNVD
jgi:hypothetical protein